MVANKAMDYVRSPGLAVDELGAIVDRVNCLYSWKHDDAEGKEDVCDFVFVRDLDEDADDEYSIAETLEMFSRASALAARKRPEIFGVLDQRALENLAMRLIDAVCSVAPPPPLFWDKTPAGMNRPDDAEIEEEFEEDGGDVNTALANALTRVTGNLRKFAEVAEFEELQRIATRTPEEVAWDKKKDLDARRRAFLALAKEIIARVTSNTNSEWWHGIEPLSARLTDLQRGHWLEAVPNEFGEQHPAFRVMTLPKGYIGPETGWDSSQIDTWLNGPRDETITVMVTSDPYLCSKSEIKLHCPCGSDKHHIDEAKAQVTVTLQSWIRAVEARLQIPDLQTHAVADKHTNKQRDDVAFSKSKPSGVTSVLWADADRQVIADTLSGQQLKLFKLLWGISRWTYYGDLKIVRAEKLWRGQPDPGDLEDVTVFEALRKLQKAMLPEWGYVVKIENESRRVKIER